MNNLNFSWEQDEFEDAVDRALICMYESKKVKSMGGPKDGLNEKRMRFIRNMGGYIPSADRIIISSEDDKGVIGVHDVKNDKYPDSGNVCFHQKIKGQEDDVYFTGFFFRKVKSLAKGWRHVGAGVNYELLQIHGENKGLYGERSFFTVTSDGTIAPCDRVLQGVGVLEIGKQQGPLSQYDCEPEIIQQRSYFAGVALQYWSDKKYCWSIRAEEPLARVTLGCQKEEIKSLLYARSLPITETGRKRPIMHLVESHKRRLRSGIDIDITPFLRGIQRVEIGNTLFTVRAPEVKKDELSKASKKYYAVN